MVAQERGQATLPDLFFFSDYFFSIAHYKVQTLDESTSTAGTSQEEGLAPAFT